MFKPVASQQDFSQMEKDLLEKWDKDNLLPRYLSKNENSETTFSFIDGPITANNPMGVHHAWGRTYKDVFQRYHNLIGDKQRFQNGFDCQGLWVEVEVEKELGLKSKKDIEELVPGNKNESIAKFVEMCKSRVKKYAEIQTNQTKRLGNFMDWENSYFTMDPENNYTIWHFLKKCYENEWIYKGKESVPWCPRCETAISQHEMLTEDYKELVHDAIYLELPLLDHANEYLLIWTTTPWTIPANIAVAVNVDLDYSLIEGESGDKFWVATDSVERVFGDAFKRVVKTVGGEELVGLKYKGPFDDIPAVKEVEAKNQDTFHTVIATDDVILPITAEEGTGLVHTAVSAGVEDFKLGKKYNLPFIEVIADNADYLPTMGELSGKNAKKHPEIIFEYLKEKETNGENWIFATHKFKHRYPACWRCKTELVWKIADEWYIAMDQPMPEATAGKASSQEGDDKPNSRKSKTFRQLMIESAQQITWKPGFGLERELDWLNHMSDWLISKKNRYWGLALPIYECTECGYFEVIGSEAELKERSVEGWGEFEGHTPHKPYIDFVKINCSKCNHVTSRIADVGNPWLDAGIVPFSTITRNNTGEPLYFENRQEWQKWFPGDFITESFPGQFKNWFYSLIAMSSALMNQAPFKTVLGFGTLLAEDGRPMHKSWGNSIEFNEGADKIGADVMRWMFARQNPSENMLFGYKKADEVRRQFYLMMWNTYRFFIEYANLEPQFLDNLEEVKSDNILDQWLMARIAEFTNICKQGFENYDIQEVTLQAEEFVSDFSTWYIRQSRERLWVSSDDDTDKKAFYKTSKVALETLATILSPVMPFITEEIYQNLTGSDSVHLANWPKFREVNADLIEDMRLVRLLAEAGHRARREKQLKVRQKLNSVRLVVPKDMKFILNDNLEAYKKTLASELNVNDVEIRFGESSEANATFDEVLTDRLIEEGEVRDIIRKIQIERKELNLSASDYIIVTIPQFPEWGEEIIKKNVMAKKITVGDKFEVSKVE